MSCNNNKLTDNAIDIFFNYNIVVALLVFFLQISVKRPMQLKVPSENSNEKTACNKEEKFF